MRRPALCLGALIPVVIFLPAVATADYMKLDTPPDVDKDQPDLSCWLATAANMLAGAEYGEPSNTMQQNADIIYNQMLQYYDPYT